MFKHAKNKLMINILMNYSNHYSLLIEKARHRVLSTYTERHHIIPKCMGGSNDASNIVSLTPEEHFVAHQLLTRIYPGNHKLILAVRMMTMSKDGVVRNNKLYSWLKCKFVNTMREIGRPPSHKGVPKSENHKRLIGLSNKGKVISEESKIKMREAHKGKAGTRNGATLSKDTKAKISASVKNIKKNECPFCGIEASPGNFARWHGINCRNKND